MIIAADLFCGAGGASVKRGMGSHESPRMISDTWLTPPEIITALGEFDLDPCCPLVMPWSTAAKHYTIEDDGLKQTWNGRVWLNPPYGNQAAAWLAKLAAHGNGIALIFARTDTEMFSRQVWDKADGLLFLEGRLAFYHIDGRQAAAKAGAPSVLVAYGQENVAALRESGIKGALVEAGNATAPAPRQWRLFAGGK